MMILFSVRVQFDRQPGDQVVRLSLVQRAIVQRGENLAVGGNLL